MRRDEDRAAAPPLPEPLGVPAIDSHCHLDIMQRPVPEVLAQARAVGINRVVTVGTDVPSSRFAVRTANSFDDVFAAVAIHPNDVPQATDADLEAIAQLARDSRVRAVGETGLDYYRTGPEGRGAQQDGFRFHIELAKQTGRTLVIHDRDAHDDVLRILEEQGAPPVVVFHCFSGDADLARLCAERGYYMSFAGNVTFKSAEGLRRAAAVVPPELLLVETDAPFLTPVPYRGRPNAPYLVPVTLRALAAIKDCPLDDLCSSVWHNAQKVFGA